MSQIHLVPRRRVALLGATAALAGLASGAANAQITPAPAPSTVAPASTSEQIVVTGTRIQNTNANAANPITVITAKQISQSSAQTVEDVLQKDVSFGSSGLYGNTNNGGNGLSCTDIRNLGITRVLVLVDGQRVVHNTDGAEDCVDLNNIPLNMIDHIDVLKDGASSTYGADAVAGVVNIILKHHFSGSTATLEGDLPTRRGGSTGELSDTTGVNFDKGNLTIGIDYLSRAAVSQGDRNWSNRITSDSKPATTASSGFVPGGQVIGLFDSNDLLAHSNGTYTPFSDSDRFNYAPYQDLVGSLEKETISAVGNYDINEYMTAYIDAFFTHKFTSEQLAPEPVYAAGGSNVLPSLFVVPFGAPGNTTALPGSGLDEDYILLQRETQLGPREYQQTSNTFQSNQGIRGTLPYDVNYDAFYNYGVSDATAVTKNSVNVTNLENLVGYDFDLSSAYGGLNGTFNPAKCPSNIGCQNYANLSPAALNYIRYSETDTQQFSLRTYGGDISKSNVLALPYGNLGLALGFDHREEHGAFSPDNLVQTGETNETAQQPTDGGFSVNEVYGEANIPILADLPFVKILSLDLSGRYFSYNTFGSGETWKITANYTPVDDVRFRGTIGTAFRQPTVDELYGGQFASAESGSDPCLVQANGQVYYLNYTAAQQAVAAANCKADKVKPGTTQLGNSQINTLAGGNPALEPETARTEDIGVIVKPHWVPNSYLTVDFWRTKINNEIGALPTQTILDECYQSVNESSPLCADLGKGAAVGDQPGAIGNSRNALGQLNELQAIDQNLGVEKTQGIDATATYNLPIGNYGALSESNELTYVLNFYEQNYTNGPFIDENGTVVDGLNGNGFPRWRDNNVLTWLDGPFTLAYTARFISGMNFQANNNPADDRVTKTADILYHDLEGTYTYMNDTLTVGVDNILDTNPPFVPDDTTNTTPAVYDVVGRTIYAKLAVKF